MTNGRLIRVGASRIPCIVAIKSSAGKVMASSSAAPASETPANLTTLDSKSLQALADAEAAAPRTTQVIDHRTRVQQRFHTGQASATSRLDIREGHSIGAPPRIGRQE